MKMVVFHEYQHHLQATSGKFIIYGHNHTILNASQMEIEAGRAVLQNAQRLGLSPGVIQDQRNYIEEFR